MEIIIAIAIVVAFVAVWFNRKKPTSPVVEAETFSDNGIKFVAPEPTPAAPVAVVVEPAVPVAEPAPAKKPRAKKPAVVAKTPTNAKKPVAKKPAKAPTKKTVKTTTK